VSKKKVIKPINNVVEDEVNLISNELEQKVKATVNSEDTTTEDIIIVEEAKKEEEEIVLIKQIETVAPSKLVKICMKKYHRCCIGGEWYVFNEGKQYNVPENVKAILVSADLLQPL
jgi:hypothetical protein